MKPLTIDDHALMNTVWALMFAAQAAFPSPPSPIFATALASFAVAAYVLRKVSE